MSEALINSQTQREWAHRALTAEARIEELEAQLAKAVEALGGMVDLFSADNVLRKGLHLNMELDHARTTLAELKGQDNGY